MDIMRLRRRMLTGISTVEDRFAASLLEA